MHLKPPIDAAKRVTLCLPLPPTPTSMALPLGCRRMREARVMCSTASVKNTRLMVLLELMLYSSRYSSISPVIFSTSVTIS